MPSLAEHRTDPELELKYRRGYIHGAFAMLDAAAPYLPEVHARILRAWAAGPLMEWSVGEGEFLPPAAPSIEVA
jgi:hypothetical protein